jgi:hypothetical protein
MLRVWLPIAQARSSLLRVGSKSPALGALISFMGFSTMCHRIRVVLSFFALLTALHTLSASQAHANDVSLEAYTCAEFLADSKKPGDGGALVKSLMMIAWATGFASGRSDGHSRADGKAFQLMAATLGDVCRKDSGQLAMKAFTISIESFLKRPH